MLAFLYFCPPREFVCLLTITSVPPLNSSCLCGTFTVINFVVVFLLLFCWTGLPFDAKVLRRSCVERSILLYYSFDVAVSIESSVSLVSFTNSNWFYKSVWCFTCTGKGFRWTCSTDVPWDVPGGCYLRRTHATLGGGVRGLTFGQKFDRVSHRRSSSKITTSRACAGPTQKRVLSGEAVSPT